MTNISLPSEPVRSMTERNMINRKQNLMKIRAYLLESIALAANEIAEIDELLKQN